MRQMHALNSPRDASPVISPRAIQPRLQPQVQNADGAQVVFFSSLSEPTNYPGLVFLSPPPHTAGTQKPSLKGGVPWESACELFSPTYAC
jgi:hypothetical protein